MFHQILVTTLGLCLTTFRYSKFILGEILHRNRSPIYIIFHALCTKFIKKTYCGIHVCRILWNLVFDTYTTLHRFSQKGLIIQKLRT
jgi:hypothetical protein